MVAPTASITRSPLRFPATSRSAITASAPMGADSRGIRSSRLRRPLAWAVFCPAILRAM